jgi:hypothetical protein
MPRTDQPSSSIAPTNGKVNAPLQQAIEALLTDRPVAYHPILAHVFGSALAALLLSQLLYWQPRSRDEEGWFYKDRDEIFEETGLTRDNQETARALLRKPVEDGGVGIIEEKYAGMPRRLYYRINMGELTRRLAAYAQGRNTSSQPQAQSGDVQLGAFHPTSRVHSTQQAGGVSTSMSAGTPPANTETTTETTQRTQQQATVTQPGKPDPVTAGSDVVVSRPGSQKRSDERSVETVTTIKDEPPSSALIDELVSRGVGLATAKALVRGIRPNLIREKIALFDWAKLQRPGLISKSDGGWLRMAIETNYPLPAEYAQAGEQEKRRQIDQEKQEAQAHQAVQDEFSRMSVPPQRRVTAYLDAKDRADGALRRPKLAKAERESLFIRMLEQYTSEQQEWFDQHPEFAECQPDWLKAKQGSGSRPARVPAQPAKPRELATAGAQNHDGSVRQTGVTHLSNDSP